jgi:esterase
MNRLLHCRSHGAGERVVILLHGLLGQGANLESIARALAADGFRVLFPDLRNHGRSFHAPNMDYRSMAEDVVRLMDESALASVTLLGHSMGGKVAMQIAFDHPARCQRLIVADIAPVAYAAQHLEILAALAAIDDPALDRNATRALLEKSIAEPTVVALLLMSRARHDDGSWFWRFDIDALEHNYADLLAAPRAGGVCDVPTCFIRGERSDYVTEEHAATVRRLFSRMEILTIADAGHWLHAEQPARFLDAVRGFLH